MTGSLTLTGAGSNLSISGTTLLTGVVTMVDDLNVDSGVLFVDASANEVGINAGTNPVANLHVQGDSGIMIRTSTNATGAQIRFSDQAGTYAQQGTIKYLHSDASTPGSSYGNAFVVEGTETLLAFKVTGDIIASRRIGINIDNPLFALDVVGNARISDGITVDNASDNSGAPIHFLGSNSQRNFRVGNQLVANDLFTIQASTTGGGSTWEATPAFTIDGSTNRIAINTTATSGNDPESNTLRNYQLNIQGDVNFNGTLYQNNAEFVTSRWTESPNGNNIYRPSFVGINFVQTGSKEPAYPLEVYGGSNVLGTSFSGGVNTHVLHANGDKQWIDTYGVMKANRNTISENVTIPANTNCGSFGPLEITNGTTITISNGAAWSIL